jgi:hypothetical protein
MNTGFQEGQKVQTPDGEGSIVEIIGEQVTVKLASGEENKYKAEDLTDDADQG